MTHLYPSGTGRCRTCDHLLQYCKCKAVERDATAKHASLVLVGGVWTVADQHQADWLERSALEADRVWGEWERIDESYRLGGL